MKKKITKFLLFGTALTLVGGQIAFAADQVRHQTRNRVKNQTCIKDGSGTKTMNTNQNRNMKQNRSTKQNNKGFGKALQSGK